MTAKVVTVTSGKGGVGKTTSVANIAVALAARGQRVHLHRRGYRSTKPGRGAGT